MAVEIIHDVRRSTAAIYCTTSDWAFGPVFTGPGCDQDAQDFLAWIARSPDCSLMNPFGVDGTDARDYTDSGLQRMYGRWQQAADKYGQVEA